MEIVASFRMILQPIRVFSCMIPNDISQCEQSELFLHHGRHLADLRILFFDTDFLFEKIWSKRKLIIDTVRRVAIAAMIQWSEMNHIVALGRKDFKEIRPL